MDTPLLILYGSQTGNSQDVAERLGREAQLLLFRPRVLPMDSYDVSGLPQEQLLLCITSTTGQGDMPDNMRGFWRFLLRKSLPPDSLAATQYAVFGLGDSGYPQFNVAAKKLFRRLQALGARPLCELGLGDDQHPSGYEAALDAWATTMWPRLRAAAGPLPAGVAQPVLDSSTLLQLGQPKFEVALLPHTAAASMPQSAGPGMGTSPAAPTGSAESLTADGNNGTLHASNSSSSASKNSCAQWRAAVAAGVAFRRVAAAAAGVLPSNGHPPTSLAGSSCEVQAGSTCYDRDQPYFARVLVNRRLTSASHFQDTRHIELDLGESGITYKPGDVLAIVPRTVPAAVDALLLRMGLQGSQCVRVTPSPQSAGGAQAGHTAQCVATVRDLVQGALDIAGASPRRYFFQVLSHFAGSAMERERLQLFASADGRDDLYTYCAREGRTVLEVLNDFRSVQLPLVWLLEACPPLHSRLFSMSSAYSLQPGRAHITVALVEYTTPYKRRKKGLCSSYLATLQPVTAQSQGIKEQAGAQQQQQQLQQGGADGSVCDDAGQCVAVWVEPGSLRLPPSLSTPLVMVGPGTGVAPFRSFLQDRLARVQVQHQGRAAQQQQQNEPQQPQLQVASSTSQTQNEQQTNGAAAAAACDVCPSHLFFGCRSQLADFYYAEEWRDMQAAGVLAPHPTGIVTAFSRDQPHKVYVTHKIREHGAALWQLLQQGAWVYVSGSAQKMPAQVLSALQDVVQEHGGLSKEEAAAYLRRLELTGRYQVEAWS